MIDIRSSDDFIKFCSSPQSSNSVRIIAPRIVIPPTGVTLTVSGINIKPDSSLSHVVFTGGRLTLMNCVNVALEHIGFRTQRLKAIPSGLHQTYEKSWKGLAILSTGVGRCKNIELWNCSFSGHTDEIEIAPLDREWWFANQPGTPAVQDVKFDQCVIGPSFINTGETITNSAKRAAFLAEREFHNFGMSATCVSGLVMKRCLAVGNNRRSLVQIAGSASLEQCIIDNWGTMGIGVHQGSQVSVNACKFIRGPKTKSAAIAMVYGTKESPFGVLNPASVGISKNCTEYNTSFLMNTKGWDCWDGRNGDWNRVAVGGSVQSLEPLVDTLRSIGCGDELDVRIRVALNAKKHVPWMRDYSAEWPLPK